MIAVVSSSTVAAEPIAPGVTRQSLLASQACGVAVDRVTLAPGAATTFQVSAGSVAWLIGIDGEAFAKTPFINDPVTQTESMFFPPGWDIGLSAQRGASILSVEVADVLRLDPAFSAATSIFVSLNWMRELVFECEGDERKRVPMVSRDICGMAALRIDMVIYPAGRAAPKFRRCGAAMMIFVVAGQGTIRDGDRDLVVKPGDLVHIPDGEWNELRAGDGEQLRFIQIDAPGASKTEWANPGMASRWRRSEFDIRGRRPGAESGSGPDLSSSF